LLPQDQRVKTLRSRCRVAVDPGSPAPAR
jgi:hypothetical protein